MTTVRMRPFEPRTRAGPTAAAEAGGILTVDLTAVVANWRELRKRAPTAQCAAVVKADAYGLGLKAVGQALAQAGCTTFFVALLDEARRLRAALPGATIYVLNGLNPDTAEEFRTLRAEPVLSSWPEIDEWDNFARYSDQPLPAAIHIDTGMGRLGLSPADAKLLAERLRLLHFKPSLIMSHLACADEPKHPATAKQIALFRELRALFPDRPASLANSAGVIAHPASHFDLVRPGVALFGGRAVLGEENPMRATVRLDLRIVQVRRALKGDTVGYGAAEKLKRDSRIAVCSGGYSDGILRAAGSSDRMKGAEAIVAGRRCPLVGRVSMDLITVDVSGVPEDQVKRGDLATLLDDEITVDDLAAHAGTIGYEILVNLGRRYARVYIGG